MVRAEKHTSHVTNEVRQLVRSLLQTLEFEHEIEILLASEHGSRAWGYSSDTSDYDVKFIYRFKEDRYKQLQNPPQHLSWKSPCGLYDLNGWDIRKSLLLLHKGNAQLYEFFKSPVKYKHTLAQEISDLEAFTNKTTRRLLPVTTYHYYALAQRTYKERIRDVGEPTLKKYFYIIRPLLCVEYIKANNDLPILEFEQLLETNKYGLISDPIYDTVQELLSLKRDGKLTKDVKKRVEHLDTWIEHRLDYWQDRVRYEPNDHILPLDDFNEIYKKLAFKEL